MSCSGSPCASQQGDPGAYPCGADVAGNRVTSNCIDGSAMASWLATMGISMAPASAVASITANTDEVVRASAVGTS
jgi:hypothetical protein